MPRNFESRVVAKYGKEFGAEICKQYSLYFCGYSRLTNRQFDKNVEFVAEQISLNEQYQAQH